MPEAPAALAAALADRYRLERPLGQGGMATVYLAEDLRHHRRVALKVLRPELAAVIGAERFLHEIRTTANLQHPHILPLFDSGQVEGTVFYVMPFVEGETLRDRLAREKQLPVDQAVQLAGQVAAALDYAHRHGVIHRDIKPENILLHDGTALVADFGIALAAVTTGGTRMTETGMSLGTPHYMSPEQAMGERDITARSDVYALGVVTYEMLTGEPPFTGATAQAIVARVVTEEPRPIIAQRKTVPPHVEDAVLTALSKLPADRFASAADFARALTGEAPGRTRARGPAARGAGGRDRFRSRGPVVILGGLLLATGAIALWATLRPPPPSGRTYRFEIFIPASEQFAESPGRGAALAPDGSGFVYVGVGPSSARRLYYRRFDRLESEPIAGTDDGEEPFFSPDGATIGFRLGNKTVQVPLGGGPPAPLAAVPSRSGCWLDDGSVLFINEESDAVLHRSRDGARLDTLVQREELGIGSLSPVPGSRYALVQVVEDGLSRVAVLDVERRTLTPVVEGQIPAWSPSGDIIFRRGSALYALSFQASRGTVTGEPVEVLSAGPGDQITDFAVSRDGTFILLGRDALKRGLVEVDRQGRERRLDGELRGFDSPRYSPDGRHLTVRERTGNSFAIWVYDLARGTNFQLSLERRLNYYPEWWPDGRRIIWVRGGGTSTGGNTGLYVKNADGSGPEEVLYDTPQAQYEGAVTRDGRWLVVRQNDSVTGRDLWLVKLADGSATPLLRTADSEHNPKLSPDGRFLAYVSNTTGRAEVYVRTFPDSGATWVVSRGGGAEPAWGPDGRELFYRSGDALLRVPVETRAGFSAGRPDTLFSGLYVPNANHTNYDVHPDGTRFVMVRMADGERRALVVVNWAAELVRKRGAGR
ncbi:MAG: serine/threonine-protein kinase [Gemmatimonadetes bacterium]|nr:serine/threonine-protein kinase [Gemmatimonadota bacterium]